MINRKMNDKFEMPEIIYSKSKKLSEFSKSI